MMFLVADPGPSMVLGKESNGGCDFANVYCKLGQELLEAEHFFTTAFL